MGKYGIVILGNGFDLFHGHKTSYKDFIEAVKIENQNNLWINYFIECINIDGWVDIENQFSYILDLMTQLTLEYTEYNKEEPVDLKYKDLLTFLGFKYKMYLETYYENVPSKFSSEIDLVEKQRKHFNKIVIFDITYNEFLTNNVLNFNFIKTRIIEDFLHLKSLLQEYITSEVVVEGNEKYSNENTIHELVEIYDHLVVINFNYTDTLSYYNENITNIFVHGSIDDEIIFGHNNIENVDYSIFNKHVQTQIKASNYKHKFEEAIASPMYATESLMDLIILGHSFDANDHGVISWIYKTLLNNRIILSNLISFYYPSKYHTDQIKRNHNIKLFFECSENQNLSLPLDYVNAIREKHSLIPVIKLKFGKERRYSGNDELDYLSKSNSLHNIELK